MESARRSIFTFKPSSSRRRFSSRVPKRVSIFELISMFFFKGLRSPHARERAGMQAGLGSDVGSVNLLMFLGAEGGRPSVTIDSRACDTPIAAESSVTAFESQQIQQIVAWQNEERPTSEPRVIAVIPNPCPEMTCHPPALIRCRK